MTEWTGRFPVTSALLRECLGGLEDVPLRRVRDRSLEVGIARIVARYLEAHAVDGVDEVFGEATRSLQLRQAVLRGELERVASALSGEVDFLVMKGEAFNRLFFGDDALRDYGDLDLLVHLEEVERAAEILGELGYEPMEDPIDPWRNKAYPCQRPDAGLTVDLHWSPVYPSIPHRTTEELFASARSIAVADDFEVQTLSLEDTFLHACYHFFLHVGFLKGSVDVALFLDSRGDELDPSALRTTTDRLGISNLVGWPIAVLARSIPESSPVDSHLHRWSAAYRDVVRRPRVSAAARMWSDGLRGRLARDEPIEASSMYGAKATGLTRGARMLWQMASRLLLDRYRDAIRAAFHPFFVGPEALAALAGRDRPAARDYLHTAARPLLLAAKQAAELLDNSDR